MIACSLPRSLRARPNMATSHPVLLRNPVAGALLAGLLWPALSPGQKNSLPFDWAARPRAGQTVNAPGLELSGKQRVTIRITNVNDIFYTYDMSCTSTPKESGLEKIVKLLVSPSLERQPAGCDKDAKELVNQIDEYLRSPGACGKDCQSVALETVIDKLSNFRTQIESAAACQGLPQADKDLLSARDGILQKLLAKSHEVTFPAWMSPDYDYTCTITESHNRQPTKDGSMTISIKPINTILTLSVGPLFSAIANRTYSAVIVPNADATGTNTILGVQGNSFSAAIAALVNFRLPVQKLSSDNLGLDLAAGPVIRLNSRSSTSAAGFFAGLSIRLYRYFFLTPGVHVGEFADFPAGFSGPGHPIPPNFPTPAPVTRTTAKFGIALSFQTKDFSSLGKSTITGNAPKPAATSEGGAPQPQPQTPRGASGGAAGAKNSVVLSDTAGEAVTINVPGTPPAEVTLTLKNGTKKALENLTVRLPNGVKADAGPCQTIAAGAECAVKVTIGPEAGAPATILITLPNGTQQAVVLKWGKQS